MKLISKFQNGGGYDGMSFGKAFQAARKAGLDKFKWRGGEYGTKYKTEVNTPHKVVMGEQQLPGITKISDKYENLKYIADPIGNYMGEYGNRFNRQQAQRVVDESGHKGQMYVVDDEGKAMSRVGEAEKGHTLAPGFYGNAKTPVVGSGLNEVVVLGHRTNIDDKTPGFIPVKAEGTKNPTYQDQYTGELYMTNPKTGQIMFSSPDETTLKNPSQWTNYYTGMNGDEGQAWGSFYNNQGARQVAVDRQTRENQAADIQQRETDRRQLANITQAQERGAQYINAPFTIASHAIWGAFQPGYVEGFGFKRGADGKIDWYGPNEQTVTGLGSRIAKYGRMAGWNPTGPLAQSLIATGDIAGNAALANLGNWIPEKVTTGKGQGFTSNVTIPRQEAYPTAIRSGRAINASSADLVNGRGVIQGRFGGNQRGAFVGEWNTSGEPMVTNGARTTNNRASVMNVGNNGQVTMIGQQRGAQSPRNFRVRYNSNPTWREGYMYVDNNTTMPINHEGIEGPSFYVPGRFSTYPGYAPRDNFSGIMSVPAPLRYNGNGYSVHYEPSTSANDPYRQGMLYDASKSYNGSAGKDVMSSGNVTVGTSNNTVNQKRSKGRKSGVTIEKRNKQSRGTTDNTDK